MVTAPGLNWENLDHKPIVLRGPYSTCCKANATCCSAQRDIFIGQGRSAEGALSD